MGMQINNHYIKISGAGEELLFFSVAQGRVMQDIAGTISPIK